MRILNVQEQKALAEILANLKQDFTMLKDGEWIPDDDSCQCSIDAVEKAQGILLAQVEPDEVINSDAELTNLRDEFRDCLEFVGDTAESHVQDIRPHNMRVAVEAMHSTSEYSLVTGISSQCVPVDGGFWAPALVFVPYAKLDHTTVTAGHGGKTW